MPASLSMTATERFPPHISAALVRSLITKDSSHSGVSVFALTLDRTSTSVPKLKMTYGSLLPFMSLAFSPLAEWSLTES